MTDSTLSRRRQRSFRRPSVKESPSECVLINAYSLCPRGQSQSCVSERDDLTAPSIARLFLGGRPFDVARLIISVVVNAVESVPRRRRLTDFCQYVLKKILEYQPSFTHGYSASAVVRVVRRVRVKASLLSIAPCFMDYRLAITVSFVNTFMQASAGLGSLTVGSLQLRGGNENKFPAFTFTEPVTALAALASCEAETPQTSELLTCEVRDPAGSRHWREAPLSNRLSISHSLKIPFMRWLGWGGCIEHLPQPLGELYHAYSH